MTVLAQRSPVRSPWIAAAMAAMLSAPLIATMPTSASGPSARTAAVAAVTASVDVDPAVTDAVERGESVVAVVRAEAGHLADVVAAVEAAGTEILSELAFIDAIAVTVDAELLDVLVSRNDVVAVTADSAAEYHGEINPTSVKGDWWFDQTVGADKLHSAGIDGTGVGIAIVDSGVAAHPTLGADVADGFDATNTGQGWAVDQHGHGTFLAGVAIGDGTTSPAGNWDGIAPGAHVIPVKIGGVNGPSLLGLLEGLQWVHHHRASHDIEVVNLSFGTTSAQSSTVDPLNFAVQRLWADGMVVVVAAGNLGGHGPETIAKPGDDPFVITVGALDSNGTLTTKDDFVSPFSSQGPTRADGIAKPDLVAPGRSLVGPIAPGSAVDELTEAHIADGWVRATGTSMSAAVVSGAAALLLQAHPTWTPGQVKAALLDSARPGPVGDPNVDGHGILDVNAANKVVSPRDANAGIPFGTGTGMIGDSLGQVSGPIIETGVAPETMIVDKQVETCELDVCTTVVVQVEVPIDELGFFPAKYIADWGVSDWSGTSWVSDQWYGDQWYGDQWYGDQWYGDQWYGDQWYGDQWYGDQWYGDQWYGDQWYADQWYADQWYADQWYGAGWS